MMLALGGAALLLGLATTAALPASAQNRLPLDAPRPIDAGVSLWAEELTSMEIRDAIRAGTTTIIVGTGGVEQNEKYVFNLCREDGSDGERERQARIVLSLLNRNDRLARDIQLFCQELL